MGGEACAAGLRPDHLVAAGADADQCDRYSDRVGDVLQVVARVMRKLVLLAALGDVLIPAGQALVVAAQLTGNRAKYALMPSR